MDLIDVEEPSARSTTWGLVAIWATWTALLVVVALSHEMWRDELQAWAIVRESSTPFELLTNLRYEGHPPGWHLVLWPFSWVTHSPLASQFVTVACASASTWIVLRFLPYTMAVRVLLVCGYFPVFEFGVVSRSYGLLYLLVVAFLALADRRSSWTPGLVALLLAMAGTLVLALPLVVALAAGHWFRQRTIDLRRGLVVGSAVAVACLVTVLLSWAPGDGRIVEARVPGAMALDRVFRAPTRILLPASELTLDFWGRFLTIRLGTTEAFVGVVVLLGAAFLFRRSRSALVVWAISASGFIAAVSVLTLPMEPRHLSILWLSLLAAAWFAGTDAARRRVLSPTTDAMPDDATDSDATDSDATPDAVPEAVSDGAGEPLLARLAPRAIGVVVLLVAVVGAAGASLVDLREPFSGSEGAAEWIEQEADGAPVTILCATKLYYCTTVSMQLDQEAFMRADREPSSFVTWRRNRPSHRTGAELLDEVRAVQQRTGREVMIVATADNVPPGCEQGWQSPPPIVGTERMVVCRADQLTPFPVEAGG